jgi:hypothetical protein
MLESRGMAKCTIPPPLRVVNLTQKLPCQNVREFLAVLDIIMIPLSGAKLLSVVSYVYALPVHSGEYCVLFLVFTFIAL